MTAPPAPITLPGGVTLLPGDHLLYGVSGLIDRLIAIKTWSDVSHIEVYVGGGESVASRNFVGVGKYPFRREQLAYVLRPVMPLDMDAAMEWFKTVDGQGYDLIGLSAFFFAKWQASKTKQFCSEFATRFGRKGLTVPFHPEYDADGVAPATFKITPAFDWVWPCNAPPRAQP